MTGPFHTYGPACLLEDEEPELSSLFELSLPPEIRSQFFYVSSLPIDDPLAPLPPPASGQASEDERIPPKPFSARDNLALEKSWRELGKAREVQQASKKGSPPVTPTARSGIAVPRQGSASDVETRRKAAARGDGSLSSTASTPVEQTSLGDELPSRSLENRGHPGASSETRPEKYAERRLVFSSTEDDAKDGSTGRSDGNVYRARDQSTSLNESLSTKRRSTSPVDHDADGHDEATSLRVNRSRDASISGSPFIRAPISHSHSPFGRSVESLHLREGSQEGQTELRAHATPPSILKPSGLRTTMSVEDLTQETLPGEGSQEDPQIKIPVGASRLHLVELPNLKVCAALGCVIEH